MTTDSQILDKIHVNVHAVRLIPGYKATEFERRIGALIVDKYADTCDECKAVHEKNKLLPQVPANKNFFDKLGDLMR